MSRCEWQTVFVAGTGTQSVNPTVVNLDTLRGALQIRPQYTFDRSRGPSISREALSQTRLAIACLIANQ
jgi:hypothetical protein